jgi:6-pyruvoyltetrahydropterin/6-carboxytetrahydropterin synthase
MKNTISRRIEWDSAHRVLRHESKCATLHGHRYTAMLTVTAPKLDDKDRVIDFSVLKERVGGWIDATWDHSTLVNQADKELLAFASRQALTHGHRKPFAFDGEPTAEIIAAVLFAKSVELLADTGITVDAVEVFETPNCSAKVARVNSGGVDTRFDIGGES